MDIYESNRPGWKALLLILSVVALALLIAGCQAVAAPTQNTGSSDSQTPAPEIKRVPLADAKAAFDSQSAVFVDVRGAETYSQGHVPGALNIPLADIEKRAGELDPNKWIITYCS